MRVLLVGMIALAVVALGVTAIDKYDEHTCVTAAIADRLAPERSKSLRARRSRSLRRVQWAVGSGCDGFLPW